MEITWLGHSCFRLKGSHEVVITDPYAPQLGYVLGKQTARIVTVSHQHPGHSYVQGIGGEPKVVSRPGEYEIGGVFIFGIATYHDAEKGSQRGRNTIFLIDIDGVTLCHLGDLGHTLTAQQIEDISKVDVLLVPVGGVTSLNAATAAEVVRQLEPKMVLPMHYRTPQLSHLDPVEKFLREVGVTGLSPQPKLNITAANLPESTQTILLSYPA
ncbi:MAG: MBL fold metallo-hydrolase [Chloroflexi bacterium]|nr:MBL fold metallo-hydrolase [Chloroflexota bacterium]